MQAEQVSRLLEAGLPDCEVQVSGDGSHFNILVVGEVFAGMSPVKKQQLVYGVLREQFADGSIHAVDTLKTYTPEQWEQARRGA